MDENLIQVCLRRYRESSSLCWIRKSGNLIGTEVD